MPDRPRDDDDFLFGRPPEGEDADSPSDPPGDDGPNAEWSADGSDADGGLFEGGVFGSGSLAEDPFGVDPFGVDPFGVGSGGFDVGPFGADFFDAPDPEDWNPVDRRIEFNEDTERARQKAADKGAKDGELQDGSWMYRIGWDELPVTCPYEQLAFGGWTPVPLDELPGEGERGPDGEPAADVLHDALWTLLARCADERIYFCHTDHLSDRELYAMLVDDLLWTYGPCPPPEAGFSQHFDCAEDGDYELYLTYYADNADRQHWADEFGNELPQKKPLPYDRDDRLPRPVDEYPADDNPADFRGPDGLPPGPPPEWVPDEDDFPF